MQGSFQRKAYSDVPYRAVYQGITIHSFLSLQCSLPKHHHFHGAIHSLMMLIMLAKNVSKMLYSMPTLGFSLVFAARESQRPRRHQIASIGVEMGGRMPHSKAAIRTPWVTTLGAEWALLASRNNVKTAADASLSFKYRYFFESLSTQV